MEKQRPCPRPTPLSVAAPRHTWVPASHSPAKPSLISTWALRSGERGKEMIWRIWHDALLNMYCNYRAGIFPVFGIKMSIRNKLLNQQESGNGKSSRRLGSQGITANAACSCCPWALGHGDKSCAPWPWLRPLPRFSAIRLARLGLPSPTRHWNTGASPAGSHWDGRGLEHVAYEEKLAFQPPGKTLLPYSIPHSPETAPIIVFFSFNKTF